MSKTDKKIEDSVNEKDIFVLKDETIVDGRIYHPGTIMIRDEQRRYHTVANAALTFPLGDKKVMHYKKWQRDERHANDVWSMLFLSVRFGLEGLFPKTLVGNMPESAWGRWLDNNLIANTGVEYNGQQMYRLTQASLFYLDSYMAVGAPPIIVTPHHGEQGIAYYSWDVLRKSEMPIAVIRNGESVYIVYTGKMTDGELPANIDEYDYYLTVHEDGTFEPSDKLELGKSDNAPEAASILRTLISAIQALDLSAVFSDDENENQE